MPKYWNDYWSKYSSRDYRQLVFFLAIGLAAVFVVIYAIYYKPPTGYTPPQENLPPVETPIEVTPEIEPAVEVTQPIASRGDLIVAVKDVKQKLSTTGLGEATELFITIRSVQVHTTADVPENKSEVASGWTTIFEGNKSIDLLQYTDNIAFIGEKELEAGNYTQIRLYVSGATIKIDNPLFEIYNKTYPMYIPSNALKVVRPFSVQPNKTTVLTIDFDVPKMVSRTSQGYTLGPALKSISDEITVKAQILEKGKRPANLVDV